jgi:Ser/Thr protein kinase RdoA (MazF antagonist)
LSSPSSCFGACCRDWLRPGRVAAWRSTETWQWHHARGAPDDAPRVWIHADLHPFNVISLDGQFGGIIDWSDTAGGDPAVDIGFLRLLLPRIAVPAAHEAYGGVDESTAARADGICLLKAATLALADDEVVADVGWRALVELGVARPAG